MGASTALLERDDELAVVDGAVEAAVAGNGNLLLIEGEAGAGKTSLLAATAERAADRGIVVLRARGGEYEQDFPYGVIRQLAEPIISEPGNGTDLLDGTAAMAAPIFAAQPLEEGRDPFSLQHGLYWLLVNLVAPSPLALLVDDAQWADLASLRALVYCARRLEGLPVLLAMAVRSGEGGGQMGPIDELRREPHARSITPRPFTAEATMKMIARTRGRAASDGLAEACRRATAGNPLLLVELLRGLDEGGAEGGEQGAEQISELAAAGVSGSILGRLKRLGEDAIAVARATAILEPYAEVRRIRTLAELPAGRVDEACDRLIAAHLIFDTRPFGFVHPLVRAAVVTDIPVLRRAAMHLQAARVLDADGAEADGVAAQLLLAESAGDPWVVGKLRAAASAALGRGAPDAAARYLSRALDEPPSQEDRAGVERDLGSALLDANDPRGNEILRITRERLDDPELRAELAIITGNSLCLRGRCVEGAEILEESLAELPDRGSEIGLRVRGLLILQSLWGLERVPEGALPQPGEMIGTDSFGGRLVLQFAAALSAFGNGTIDEGCELAERVASSRLEELTADAMAGMPPQGAAFALGFAEHADVALSLFSLSIETSRRRGSPGVPGGYGARSLFRLMEGDLREAQADAELAVPMLHRIGLTTGATLYIGVMVRALMYRGHVDEAEQVIDDYRDGREPFQGTTGAFYLCSRGELNLARGRSDAARADFIAAGDRIGWMASPNLAAFPWRIGLARCEIESGNRAGAQRLAAQATAIAGRARDPRGVGFALRAQGQFADPSDSIDLFRNAVSTLEPTNAKLHRAAALVDLGSALRRANHRREARPPLREGLELAHRCGATPLEERARTELAAAGARIRRVALAGEESLTPSELRVAQMASAGMTNREIAQDLFVTQKTIETHLRHVFQKLEISGRGEIRDALTVPAG